MNNLNSILLEGNLVRDPESGTTPNGTFICKFSVASDRVMKVKDEYQKEVSYFDVTTWAHQAELCSQYLKKGRGVRIHGRLQQDRWQDKDGKNRTKVYIVAHKVDFKPSLKNINGQKNSMNTDKMELEAAVSY